MITTTTTTVIEERPPLSHWQGGAEDQPRYLRLTALQRARAIAGFGKIAYNYWKYRALLGFCGTVLDGSKRRYAFGRLATGTLRLTDAKYAVATEGSRWQSSPLVSGRFA